ncbi:MAG: coiled-coil protein [Candidatus Heimdallarchaeaceae archaeon]
MNAEGSKMTLEDKKAQLEAMRAKRKELIGQLREFRKKRDELRAIRDEKNQQSKEFFEKARIEREKRDEINEEVQVRKQMRDILREDADKIAKRLLELGSKIKSVGVPRNRRVRDKIQRLERELETTPFLSKEKERQTLQQLEELSAEMEKLEQFKELKSEFHEMQQKLRHIRTEIKAYHTSVTTLAQESQIHQEKMIEYTKEARRIKAEADEAHAEILALSTSIQAIRKELDSLTQNIKAISAEFSDELQNLRKTRRLEAKRQREQRLDAKAEEILERYKEGHKLTLDEFKVLMERGLI